MEFMSIFSKMALFTTSACILLSIVAIFAHIKPPKNPKSIWKIIGLGLVVAAIFSSLVGFAAYSIEMLEVEEVVSKAMPEYVDAVRKKGEGYAMVPVKIAMGNIIPFLIGVLSFVRSLRIAKN